jgi:hypothetical protein
MRKPKEVRPYLPPMPPLGKVISDFMIDMKIAELRKTIKTLEARLAELEALKVAPFGEFSKLPNFD